MITYKTEVKNMLRQLARKRQQRGIGLLELMLSLAIIAILLVMATRYFLVASSNEKINSTISTIGGMQGAVTCWRNSRGTLDQATMSNMDSIGCLPGQLWPAGGGENVVNPWGAPGTWAPAPSEVTLTLGNVPAKACKNLNMKYENDPNYDAGTCNDTGGGSVIYKIK